MTIKKKNLKSIVASSFVRRTIEDNIEDNIEDKFSSLAPYDEPNKGQLRFNRKAIYVNEHIDFQMLSTTEIKILKNINGKLKENTATTVPLFLSELSNEISHPITTLKKLIQKLEKKGLLQRVKFKPGRGGWTIYSISQNIRDKLETN